MILQLALLLSVVAATDGVTWNMVDSDGVTTCVNDGFLHGEALTATTPEACRDFCAENYPSAAFADFWPNYGGDDECWCNCYSTCDDTTEITEATTGGIKVWQRAVTCSELAAETSLEECMNFGCYHTKDACVDRVNCEAFDVNSDCMAEDQCLWNGESCELFKPEESHYDPCECTGDNSAIPRKQKKAFDLDYGKSCSAWDIKQRWCKKQGTQWPNMCWCGLEWCYVSKECHSARPSDFFKDAKEQMFFSYSACGNPKGDACYDATQPEVTLCDGCAVEGEPNACQEVCSGFGECDACEGSKGTPGACCLMNHDSPPPECLAASTFTHETEAYPQCVLLDKACEDLSELKRACTAHPYCKRNRHQCIKDDAEVTCANTNGKHNCIKNNCFFEFSKEGDVCRDMTDDDKPCETPNREACILYGCKWKGDNNCADPVEVPEDGDQCLKAHTHRFCQTLAKDGLGCIFNKADRSCANPCFEFGEDEEAMQGLKSALGVIMNGSATKEDCDSVGMRFNNDKCVGASQCHMIAKSAEDCCKYKGCSWAFSKKSGGFMCKGKVNIHD